MPPLSILRKAFNMFLPLNVCFFFLFSNFYIFNFCCSSPQQQRVCAHSSLQGKPEGLAVPEHNTNIKTTTSPPCGQLCEPQPGVSLHPQRPPVDQTEEAAGLSSVHSASGVGERGGSGLCDGDRQSLPGGGCPQTPGAWTGLLDETRDLLLNLDFTHSFFFPCISAGTSPSVVGEDDSSPERKKSVWRVVNTKWIFSNSLPVVNIFQLYTVWENILYWKGKVWIRFNKY